MLPTPRLPAATHGYEKTVLPRVSTDREELLAIEETRWRPVPETREEHSRALAELTAGLDGAAVSVVGLPPVSANPVWRPVYYLRVVGSRVPSAAEVEEFTVTRVVA